MNLSHVWDNRTLDSVSDDVQHEDSVIGSDTGDKHKTYKPTLGSKPIEHVNRATKRPGAQAKSPQPAGHISNSWEPRPPDIPAMATQAHGKRTRCDSSSSASVVKLRTCCICKTISPLDAMALVVCPSCRRNYHRGCHKPTISNFHPAWRCFRCSASCERSTGVTSSLMSPGVSKDSTFPPQVSVLPSPRKRARVDTSATPELLLWKIAVPVGEASEGAAQCPLPRTGDETQGPPENSNGAPLSVRRVFGSKESVDVADTEHIASQKVSSKDMDSGSEVFGQGEVLYRRLAAITLLESGSKELSVHDMFGWIKANALRFIEGLDQQECLSGISQALSSDLTSEAPLFRVRYRDHDATDGFWSLCTSAEYSITAHPRSPTSNLVGIGYVSASGLNSPRSSKAEVPSIVEPSEPAEASAELCEGHVPQISAPTTFKTRDRMITQIKKLHAQKFTARSLYEKHSAYGSKSAKLGYEDKMLEITARSTGKQIFDSEAATRLDSSTASDVKDNKLGLCRARKRGDVVERNDKAEGSDSETYNSLEELLGLPETVIPMICENQLAFCNGSKASA